MTYDRRQFLKTAGAITAGSFLLSQWACKTATMGMKPSLSKYGVQLWSVKEDMAKDAKGTLKQISGFGYKQIESFQGQQGIFWGMSPTEFKSFMGDLGMTIISSHCNINTDFEKTVEMAATAGLSYLICPYLGPQPKMDDFKRFADRFNQCGELCKKAGMRFAYHNHDYSFKEMDGQLPQDVMMGIADPGLVDFQLDIYWIVKAGKNPVDYFKKYPNRFRLCHVKDMSKNAPYESCDLGMGSIDYPKILKVAADQGMKYFIVEQEAFEGSTPLKSIGVDSKYMEKLVFA